MNQNNLDLKHTKKWNFVCGRAGGGKTLVSIGMAHLLSKNYNKKSSIANVNLLSKKGQQVYLTSEENNDAFDTISLKSENKKFVHDKRKKRKVLLACLGEIDDLKKILNISLDDKITEITSSLDILRLEENETEVRKKNLSPILNSIKELPGIKEALFFLQIIKNSHGYDFIVIDTWPSFSFLNFLTFPEELSTLFNKIAALDQVSSLLETNLFKEVIEAKKMILENELIENSSFTLICTPERYSLLETKKMLKQLELYNISVDNLIINQILKVNLKCENCIEILKRQNKILEKYREIPLKRIEIEFICSEIRGFDQIAEFAEKYLNNNEK